MDQELLGGPTDDVIAGGDGNDTIDGGLGNDTLQGGAGNDLLVGTPIYKDYISGGFGPDTRIYTGSGSDIYEFSAGFGNDTISEDQLPAEYPGSTRHSIFDPSVNTIRLDGSLSPSQVVLSRAGGTRLLLSVIDQPDTILFNADPYVTPWNPGYGIDWIEFADGTRWDVRDRFQAMLGQRMEGTAGSDSLFGGVGHDTLLGLDGNDTLRAYYGNNVVNGGPGDDLIYTENGVSTNWKGQLSPLLNQGSDTLSFGVGDGHDTLEVGPRDVIELRDGLTFADMRISPRTRTNAVTSSPAWDSGYVTLSWASGDSLQINDTGGWDELQLIFADGSRLSGARINEIATLKSLEATPGDDSLMTWGAGAHLAAGGQGNDRLTGIGRGDTLSGGAGNDTLKAIGEGTVLIGGAGDDLVVSDDNALIYQYWINNVYFDEGDGSDTVAANNYTTIHLGHGIDADKLQIQASMTTDFFFGKALARYHLTWGTTDSLDVVASAVAPYDDGLKRPMVSLRFTDGTVITSTDLDQRAGPISQVGTQNADSLFAVDHLENVLSGKAGNDVLKGGARNDTLVGGAGNDTMTGWGGDDLFLASSESETDGGDDVYVVYGGYSGHDTIREHEGQPNGALGASGFDVILLPETDSSNQSVTVDKVDATHLLLNRIGAKSSVLFNVAPLALNGNSTQGIEQIQFADGVKWSTSTLMQTLSMITGTDAGEELALRAEADTVEGLGGNDTLRGGPASGVFAGGEGRDLVLVAGNATSDRVLFGIGEGQDTLQVDHLDVIELGAGLTRDGLMVSPISDDSPTGGPVTLSWGTGDSITLEGSGRWDAMALRFNDGTELKGSSIIALAREAAAPPQNLIKTGTTARDSLSGGTGNDTLLGLAGNDILMGGAGNDLLDGERGNDTLRGGLGNDRLVGGRGNDHYLFARGDGQDVIVDQDGTWFNTDVLTFSFVSHDQLWLTRNGVDLNINIIGTSDKVSIAGWFSSSANRVERIVVDGGKTLSSSSVNTLVNAMAAFEPPPLGASAMSPIVETQLAKVLNASWR